MEIYSDYFIFNSTPFILTTKENITSNYTTEILHNAYEDRLTIMSEQNDQLSVLAWLFLTIPSLLLVLVVISFIVALIIKYCGGICNIHKCKNIKPEDIFSLC